MSKLVPASSLQPHPWLSINIPPLSEEEVDQLRESIEEHGILQPIIVSGAKILDGHNRWRVAKNLDIAEVPVFPYEWLDEEQEVELGIQLNAGRRHFTAEQKRTLVTGMLKRWHERSDREIARRACVGHPFVASVRASLEEAGDVESDSTRIDKRGVERPAVQPPKAPKPPKLPAAPQPAAKAEPPRPPAPVFPARPAPAPAAAPVPVHRFAPETASLWEGGPTEAAGAVATKAPVTTPVATLAKPVTNGGPAKSTDWQRLLVWLEGFPVVIAMDDTALVGAADNLTAEEVARVRETHAKLTLILWVADNSGEDL